jgi:excisionase family DNA binding protein
MGAAKELLQEIRDELRATRKEIEALRRDQVRESLSVREAAVRLGRDRNLLGRLVARGLVRAVQDGGRRRIPLEEVKRLASEGLPELPRRGRPRKAARRPGDAIRALPIRPGST